MEILQQNNTLKTTELIAVYNASVIENASLKADICKLQSQVKTLAEQVAWFNRQMFGQKSERTIELPPGTIDLPGFDWSVLLEELHNTETEEVKSHKRKKSPNKNKGEYKLELPDDLPVVNRVIDIDEADKICPETGETLICIGEDTVEKLMYNPETYKKLILHYPKYVSAKNPLHGVKRAESEENILEGSKFDASFLAHIVNEKYGFHQPLNRLLERVNLHKVKMSNQVLSSVVLNIGEKVQPLINLMRSKVLDQGYIFTDETKMKLIIKGNKKAKNSSMWTYTGGCNDEPAYHLYHFTFSMKHAYVENYLKNFEGVIHADAYSVYEKLAENNEKIDWAACWAHARRKFENSKYGVKLRATILRLMKYLFMFERIAWHKDRFTRLRIRQEKEKPIVDRIFNLLKETIISPNILPSHNIRKAIEYMLSREKYFRLYLDDPNIRMENNTAERSLRKIVLGRVNWMFVGSEKAGKASANLFSLVQTCRAMNIDPHKYLEDLFRRLLSHPANCLHEFLPDEWKKLH